MTPEMSALGPGGETRDTLQAYAQVAGAVRRNLAPAHPRWWNASLQVTQEGLETGQIEVKEGSPRPSVSVDWNRHVLRVTVDDARVSELALDEGRSSVRMSGAVRRVLADHGITLGENYNPKRSDESRGYDRDRAQSYGEVFLAVQTRFEKLRNKLTGEVGPVQLWPHHFDLSFEWFGTRRVDYRENSELVEARSQIGFGFSTGDSGHPGPYFYANPWPFEEDFASADLPDGARWNRDGWQGGLLPFAATAGADDSLVEEFMSRVFAVAFDRLG